ncbi:putative ABC transport system ATP-binding protein [Lachnospiraceae bacterium XBB1006]|nr:putative ABC transport system ATP-binding protein [Lachnospiraceae bacterium XBB1006]
MSEPILACEELKKEFLVGNQKIEVLKGITHEFYENTINLIYGKSGSGKTTFLNLLAALDGPTSGKIRFAGQTYDKKRESELARFRGEHFGFVFQAYNLIERVTVEENIKCPSYINGKRIDKAHYDYLVERLGIKQLLKKSPVQLSGGEQQRVAIARAMILKPKIVFADEPTGNLDSENTGIITSLFQNLKEEYSTTFIIVTHDEQLIQSVDQRIRIKDGELYEA